MESNFEFKTKLIAARAKYLHDRMFELMAEMLEWTTSRNLPFVVTETVTTLEEDKKVNRKEACHREGRAIDISYRGWNVEKRIEFINHFNSKYASIGAISRASGSPNLVVFHDNGNGPHFHVQLNANFKNNNIDLT